MDRTHFDGRRLASTLALAVGVVSLFVALGGVGMAQSAISASQYQYGKKATVCHKGKKTISIGRAAVPAHLRHGDTVGTCAAARAKAAKAKKAKAAKAKAAKVKAAKVKAQKAKAEKAQAQKGKSAEAKATAAEPKNETAAAAKTKQTDRGNGKSNPGGGKGK